MCTTALWILGEYSSGVDEIQASIDVIKQALGPTPFFAPEGRYKAMCNTPKTTHMILR